MEAIENAGMKNEHINITLIYVCRPALAPATKIIDSVYSAFILGAKATKFFYLKRKCPFLLLT